MALSRQDERLLSQFHKNLRQEALEPTDDFYVNLRDERFGGAVGEDVVRQLTRDVAWAEAPSVAFFSGFRGAGKSTELNRLRDSLSEEGFAVAKFSIEDYLDVRFPITAGQLVFAMTAGIWQACQLAGWVKEGADPQSPFIRLWGWLKGIHATTDAGVSLPLPDWSPVDFSVHLLRDPTFREELGEFLRPRTVELTAKANEFLNALDAQVRKGFESDGRPWLGMVVIVDSLDHARSETTFTSVRHAIREVFDLQLPLVRFERFRSVFCVPPYISPAGSTVRRIFNVKVADREHTTYQPGVDALIEVVRLRVPPKGQLEAILSLRQLAALIRFSGGHIRDLLRLLDEVILGMEALPATDADVDSAVVRLRDTFLPISSDQKAWLARIGGTHQLELDRQESWAGLAELFEYHLVLRYSNSEPWYDVHPIIAEAVGSPAGNDTALP